ncbi:ABC transporter permease [Lactobacillus sp. ESL0684]|uniref:YhgE/Pip domain-containing protein n=1 Tax=Lactobacillus sp. ESL0684 TaxID=2983213 RepID=UPI0023F617B8|nr:ABC transporter permease [Lactobacillus sp. ESL0684]WEV43343.1 ABC transporter permease [Lactobacillus sp. ESL0684]
MWKVVKSKFFWVCMVIICAFVGLLSIAQVGARNSAKVKEMPVAIVNESHSKVSKKLVKSLKDKFSDSDATLKIIDVNKESKLKQGFADKKYYGALVIDQDFDDTLTTQQNYLKGLIMQAKLAKLPAQQKASPQVKAQLAEAKKLVAQKPAQAKIRVLISQGSNMQASSLLSTALPQIGEGLGQGLAKQMQATLDKNKVTLSSAQWQTINQPIKVTTKVKNKIPDKSISGMAPMIFVMLAWISSFMPSMFLRKSHHELDEDSKIGLKTVNNQMGSGILLTVIATLAIFVIVHLMFGVPIKNTGSFLLTLALTVAVLYLLQTCLLNWFGMGGQPILMVIWLLSMAVATYPKEMLSPIFRNGVYSWTPVRFAMDLFTNNLYISGRSATTQTDIIVLVSVGLVALFAVYMSGLFKKSTAKK